MSKFRTKIIKNGFKSIDYLLEQINKCKKVITKKIDKLKNLTIKPVITMS
jgi:hypothetical protein